MESDGRPVIAEVDRPRKRATSAWNAGEIPHDLCVCLRRSSLPLWCALAFSFLRRDAARSGPTTASGLTKGTARRLCSCGDASRGSGAPARVVLGVPSLVRGSQCPSSVSQSTIVHGMPDSFLLFAVLRRDRRPRKSSPRDLIICY